jgi:hypothetical protein
MKRKSRSSNFGGYEKDFDDYDPVPASSAKRKSGMSSLINATTLFILAGVFILGIGVGMGFSSAATSGSTGQIVTVAELEAKTPNPDLCVQYGASAIVVDTRTFITLRPHNVFTSQPTTRPGCVLRTNNWSILEQRGLVKGEQVRDCKQRMNTFGYTGDLGSSPDIECIYQNDAAENLFLDQSGAAGAPAAENQRF